MAEKKKNVKEEIKDIPTQTEESPKAKKLREAPDEVIAKALHDLLARDHEM
ncbi:MAG: hypothetical protein K6A23_01400 [Butyrivibrio sp.]|nr:hypothetical protein [Butyrivibrio sp.]